QVNAFFTIYLPSLLKSDSNYKDIYTVFAGGDDFFLIGPWLTTQRLAVRLAQDFKRYVAENSDIHFSAGIATQSSKTPVKNLAEAADSA
ncbi:type III-A CRISPR-associated protein Cas10/Csm1, partial [Acinetobacter baumannii]